MIKKELLILALLATIPFAAHSQVVRGKDTTYIAQFAKQRNLQLNTWLTDVSFKINPRLNEKDFSVSYIPNVKSQMGMSFGLKSITLFLGFQIPGTESSIKDFGKTDFIDFSFGYFKNHWGGEIFFRRFNGHYIEANDTVSRTIREDAQLLNYGLNVYYVFNKKRFSYRSAIAQQELQKKSSGSVILLMNVQHRGSNADSSLIPRSIDNETNFGGLSGTSLIKFNTINLRPGYAYNFVWENGLYFISPSVFAGMGLGSYEYNGTKGLKTGITTDLDIHAKLSAGFNHNQWFGNIYFTYEQNANNFNNNRVSLQVRSIGVNIGYRINSFFGIKWL